MRSSDNLVARHVAIRSLFAVGEAGNFPASIKTVAEWFPKRERALATAIFNSGSNFGAMVAALFVPWCMIYFGDAKGWKMAFILTGAAGFFWLIFWFWLYEPPNKQKRLSKTEYDYIHVDDETAVDQQTGDTAKKVSWLKLFGYRQLWAFFAGKFMTDGIWWFYLFWLPDYLHKQFGMTKQQIMLPTFIVYGVAIVGSIFGGSVPMMLIKRGWPVYKARMTAMLIIAMCPLAVLLTQYFGNVEHFGKMAAVLAVAMICIGATAHQAWSANLFTTVSDMFPKKTVAQRHRHRHDGWRDRRRRHFANARRQIDRRFQRHAANRLPHHVHHLRGELFDCVDNHENSRAAPPAHHGFVKVFRLKEQKPVEAITSTG